jgi:hypothetical protein
MWVLTNFMLVVVSLIGRRFEPSRKKCGRGLTKEQRQLTREQRLENRALSRLRIVIEHVNRRLKIFKILGERYRNRGRRFGLRFNLICAIHNYEYVKHPLPKESIPKGKDDF